MQIKESKSHSRWKDGNPNWIVVRGSGIRWFIHWNLVCDCILASKSFKETILACFWVIIYSSAVVSHNCERWQSIRNSRRRWWLNDGLHDSESSWEKNIEGAFEFESTRSSCISWLSRKTWTWKTKLSIQTLPLFVDISWPLLDTQTSIRFYLVLLLTGFFLLDQNVNFKW
jgi:hypothetical protein